MRVATFAVLALAATATAAAVLACGGEETTPATHGDSDSGTDASPDATGEEDAGGNRAPTGCLLRTTDYTIGKKAENVPRADAPNAANWTNVEGALSEDGQFATVTLLEEGQESAELRVSDFGLTIPESAETWGIEVELKRRAPDGGVADHQINIEIEGKPTRFKYVDGPWPKSIVGTHAYGQAIDTWGIDLFPADVNKPSFAAKLSVKRTPDAVGPVTAIVDSLKIAVHFCPEPIKN